MNIRSLFVDFSLLGRNRDFRNVFIARTISLLALGILAVAVPLQVYRLSGDSARVGLAMAVEGVGMFAGLLLGGVLADRMDRRRLILFARGTCGIGFLVLAGNAGLTAPSLVAIYLLSAWDGFFGGIGVTALLAAMPAIVGREQLMQARALSMLSMRLATVLSPVLGGALIVIGDLHWAYLLTALGTGLTLLPLLGLPAMRPGRIEDAHPLRALASGLRFMFSQRVVLGAVLTGTLLTLVTAVRVLFPALVDERYGGDAWVLGLMVSAVSLGATLGAMLSGWAERLRRPGAMQLWLSLGAFACLLPIGSSTTIVLLLPLLALFGYLVSIASLLQYALVQGHTPDAYLGRVNALWTAQDASGESLGALVVGLLGKWLAPGAAVVALGAAALACGALLSLGLRALREAPPQAAPDHAGADVPQLRPSGG